MRETRDQAFLACGPVVIASRDDVTGQQPMNITWTLTEPLTAHAFRAFSVIREM